MNAATIFKTLTTVTLSITLLMTGGCNNMETKVAYIPLVCVDVEYRGQHIATELMNRAISLVKSRGMQKIGIHTNNKFAKSMYVKMGFQLIWERYQTDIKTDRYYLEKNFN